MEQVSPAGWQQTADTRQWWHDAASGMASLERVAAEGHDGSKGQHRWKNSKSNSVLINNNLMSDYNIDLFCLTETCQCDDSHKYITLNYQSNSNLFLPVRVEVEWLLFSGFLISPIN